MTPSRATAVFSAACLVLVMGAFRSGGPQIDTLATNSIRDLQATVSVVSANQEELMKINRDFGMTYRLKELVMSYKDPDKLRMEGRLGLFIVNGSARLFKVPQLRLTKRDDLGASPGKRYSLIEAGLLSKSALAATDAKYLRDEALDGLPAHVFEIAYRGDSTCHNIVWIDEKSHAIRKREWYDSNNKLKATFMYLDPKEIGSGVWLPTRLVVRNAEGAVAGVTAYSEIKVNQGLPDTLFEIGG